MAALVFAADSLLDTACLLESGDYGAQPNGTNRCRIVVRVCCGTGVDGLTRVGRPGVLDASAMTPGSVAELTHERAAAKDRGRSAG
ncbi:MAG: hypothetical protein ACRD8A_03180 [Candidatus Acidiferrales bacterium]